MKNNITSLFFILFSCAVFAQQISKIDSLKNLIDRVSILEKEGKLEYALGLEYYNLDSLKLAEKYFNSSEKKISKDYKELIDIITSKANLYSRTNRYFKSDSTFKMFKKVSKKHNLDTLFNSIKADEGLALNNFYKGKLDLALLGYNDLEKRIEKLDTLKFEKLKMYQSVIGNKGIILANKGKIKEALEYFKIGLVLQERIAELSPSYSKKQLINSINNIALCNDMLNKGNESIKYYLKGIDIAKKYKLISSEKLLSVNLSRLFNQQRDYKKAIEYALNGIGTVNNYNFTAYNNLGLAYMRMNEIEKSKPYFYKALEVAKKNNRPRKLALIYSNIGENFSFSSKLDSAIYYAKKSINLYAKIKSKNNLASVNHLLGRTYFKKGDIKLALSYLTSAENGFQNQQTIHINHINNREYLYKVYKNKRNFKKSLEWLEDFNFLKNKYDSIRHRNEVNNLEVRYQTQEKENKILKQQTEIQKKEISLQESKTKTNLALIGVFFVVLISGVYLSKRKRDQKLKLLQESVNSSEQEKIRIGKELHDGIASKIMKLVHNTENKDVHLSHALLDSYNEIRNLSHQLNNTHMHGELFIDRIFELLPDENKNQKFDLKIEPPYLELIEPFSTHLYRIIQELVTNNLKHANASRTIFRISLKENNIVLSYQDNGVGVSKLKKGAGIKSIEDRVQILKGKIQIASSNGLLIEIIFPYKK